MICFDSVNKVYPGYAGATALAGSSLRRTIRTGGRSTDARTATADSSQLALQNVSFSLQTGSFNFITGHSGAGKSTLLRLLAGLDRPSSGEIYLGDQALHALSDARLTRVRENMGIVFQDNQLLYDRSVFDNIALPLIISRHRKREILARVSAALQRVGLADRADAMPEVLSGGEQQRVGIARAVVNRPRILLADEPTGNLDPGMSHDILRLFRHFNAAGVTVVIATHDLTLLETRHHNRLVLVDGQLQGAPPSNQAVGSPHPAGASTIPRRKKHAASAAAE